MLGVDPVWRGQGLASKLITYAENVAYAESAHRLTLNVVSDNVTALKLYRKMGFETTMVRHSQILQWITGHQGYLEMVKRL